MKKTLIFIILILLLVILAFPVVFAEGNVCTYENKNKSGIDAEVLSNMDNYMKLNNPNAIDKTDKYLAVANNKTLFVQPQNTDDVPNNTKNSFYLDLISSENTNTNIINIVIVDSWVVALITDDNNSKLILVDAKNKTKFDATIKTDGIIYNITRFQNKLAVVCHSSLYICNIENNDISQETTYKLNIGYGDHKLFKIINDIPYVFNKNSKTIQKCSFNNDECTNVENDKIVIGQEIINDFIVTNNHIYFVDKDNKLFYGVTLQGEDANYSTITVDKDTIKFNKIVFEKDKLFVAANNEKATDNGKVYVFDPKGNQLAKITSKGDDLYRFDSPQGVFSDGEHIYIADTNNRRIIKRNDTGDESKAKRYEIKLTGLSVDELPQKVVANNGAIYFTTNKNNLYKTNNVSNHVTANCTIINNNASSIALYNEKLLILSGNQVDIYDGENSQTFIPNTSINADEIAIATNTNFAYLINKKNGEIAKFNLENQKEVARTSNIDGDNYSVDFKGNLYVRDGNKITIYSQRNNQFDTTTVTEYTINGLSDSSNLAVAIDPLNGVYYFSNIDDHLLFKINGSDIGLIGTKDDDYKHPTKFDIIKAGCVKNQTTAFLSPDNNEATRTVDTDEIFLVLAEKTDEQLGKTYYYVISKNLSQTEYIEKDDFGELEKNINMNNTRMSATVTGVQVYKYPFKTAELVKTSDGKNVVINEAKVNKPIKEVTCLEKVAGAEIWDWYKIRLNKNGEEIEGYVLSDYLAKVVPTTPPNKISFMKTKAPKIGTNIKIYENPDINSTVLFGNVKDGIDIQIVGDFNINSTFTKVYYEGQIGFILTENLQPNGLTPNQIIAITISSVAIVAFAIIGLLFLSKNKRSKKKPENIDSDITA